MSSYNLWLPQKFIGRFSPVTSRITISSMDTHTNISLARSGSLENLAMDEVTGVKILSIDFYSCPCMLVVTIKMVFDEDFLLLYMPLMLYDTLFVVCICFSAFRSLSLSCDKFCIMVRLVREAVGL